MTDDDGSEMLKIVWMIGLRPKSIEMIPEIEALWGVNKPKRFATQKSEVKQTGQTLPRRGWLGIENVEVCFEMDWYVL